MIEPVVTRMHETKDEVKASLEDLAECLTPVLANKDADENKVGPIPEGACPLETQLLEHSDGLEFINRRIKDIQERLCI